MSQPQLQLKDFTYAELFEVPGLARLDQAFLAYLQAVDQLLHGQLLQYRQGEALALLAVSELLINCAPILEAFIAELFGIEDDVGLLQVKTHHHDPIFVFKSHFVLKLARRALKKTGFGEDFESINQHIESYLSEQDLTHQEREWGLATLAVRLLEDPQRYETEIAQLTEWCVAALKTQSGQAHVKDWVSFKLPSKLNFENLVDVHPVPDDNFGRLEGPTEAFRKRDGFHLTDKRMSLRQVMSEINYCVYCHKTEGDFCSKGFPVKKTDRAQGLKINPVGDLLTGCPLEEKISEMHLLKKAGYGVAALSVVMIDNPFCPATGHRICNDCMKACIYQKQEPVNIPEVETRILTDVLDLPWGVEIFDLLTRWNPLRARQFLPKSYNGLKILVMGMGPAGFTLAHHLLMEGFAVVGADGLKLEPLPADHLTQPIYRYSDLHESLSDRVMAGFGGVAEYGITVRWDKNFLKLIYISLQRRKYFQVFGSIRFGGTLTVDDAWRLGFDHLAIAVGAGLPRELKIPHSLAPGMRQANDFLMALQLTGAAKRTSMANLQVRLPAVVIGGGLTGVDTATEVQAYYIIQVEKIYHRYQMLCEHIGEKALKSDLTEAELEILAEFLVHGKAVAAERARASTCNEPPNFIPLLRQWGGVTIVYRRSMQESPAYKRNHEELAKAFEEGIYYAEGLEPAAVELDQYGAVNALICNTRVLDESGHWHAADEQSRMPARAIFVATGAKPNVAYEFEHRGSFAREGFQYCRFELRDDQLVAAEPSEHVKSPRFGAFTSYDDGQHHITFLGDTHPTFHGSVVKAIASAKRVYPKIVNCLESKIKVGHDQEYEAFRAQMTAMFKARIVSVDRINQEIVELTVKAPLAAQSFKPGQFYRLQNYEALAPVIAGQRMQMEALALIAYQDHRDDCLKFLVQSRGVSSRLVQFLKEGQHISLMGPTGVRSKIPETPQTIMIIGGVMAITHLFSYAPALKSAGHRIIFVATFSDAEQLILRDRIEALADVVLWITANAPVIAPSRPQDRAFQGDLILALRDFAMSSDASFEAIGQVVVIGSSELIRAVQSARSGLLQDHFSASTEFVAAVHGPMQCMLKGVCAQCLQWQIDPKTGRRTKAVYACSWQNQPMEIIDIDNIDERLAQNSLTEKLANKWLDYLFIHA